MNLVVKEKVNFEHNLEGTVFLLGKSVPNSENRICTVWLISSPWPRMTDFCEMGNKSCARHLRTHTHFANQVFSSKGLCF